MGIENIRLGTCNVLLGGSNGSNGQDMGLTIGGVEVSVETATHETMVDQFGDTPVKSFIQGRNVKVTMNLAETTVDKLAMLMPGATLLSTGGKRVDVTTAVGIDLFAIAQELTLHPISLPLTDTSEDFTLPKAATAGAINFAYKKDDERVFTAEFIGFPAQDTGILFSYGDPDATA